MARNLTGPATAPGQILYSSSATARHTPGELFITNDGRKFRYVKAGGTALVVGNMIQARAQDADHDQLTPAAAAIGATQITVTTGSSALDANEYAGGWAVIDTTPGLGYAYPISSHPAASTTATCVITLAMPIQVALTTSSRVTLVPNPYDGVIQSPANTQTGAAVGAAVYPIAANEFGWIQSGGPAAVLIGGTPAVGACVVVPGDTAGEVVVDPANAATDVVGKMMVTGVDGKVLPVFLTID